MNLKKSIATTVVAATLVVGGGAVAAPAIANAATKPPAATATKGAKANHVRRFVRRHAITISAKTIGIPRKDLVAQLKDGKSIAEVAQAHNVDPQKVVAALVDAGNKAVDKAVANHRITAERGTALKAKLPALAQKAVNAHRK